MLRAPSSAHEPPALTPPRCRPYRRPARAAEGAPQRASDREVELALGDAELQTLGAISRALQRIGDADFGRCDDCGEPIAFDRLQAEPWALRCVACEGAREARNGTLRPPRL
jgi:RNA polymerase-binding transcription factor DksA